MEDQTKDIPEAQKPFMVRQDHAIVPRGLKVPDWMPDDLPAATMPSTQDLYEILDAWAVEKYQTILQVFTQKGGWEGWAQTELAMALQLQYPKITVLREVMVYVGSNKRADLVLVEANSTGHIIELKTFSGYAWVTYGKYPFVQGFISDIEKISENDLRDGVGAAVLHAIGFCCIDDANTWAQQKMNQSRYAQAYQSSTVAGMNTDDQPLLWRWSVDVNSVG